LGVGLQSIWCCVAGERIAAAQAALAATGRKAHSLAEIYKAIALAP
jgi:hypothetical protein